MINWECRTYDNSQRQATVDTVTLCWYCDIIVERNFMVSEWWLK